MELPGFRLYFAFASPLGRFVEVPPANRINAAALGILMLAGCQASRPPHVVDRLPDPAVIPAEAPPPSTAPDATPPSPRADAPPPAEWTPPGGIVHRWTSIVVHHSATPTGSLRDIDNWHRGQGWDACGYHFVIGNGTHSGDGDIEVGPRWREQSTGAHTRLYGRESSPEGNYYNEHGIGIVLVGNLDQTRPTARQMAALARLVSFLAERCRVKTENIRVHGELKPTACPGKYFSKAELLRRIQIHHGDTEGTEKKSP